MKIKGAWATHTTKNQEHGETAKQALKYYFSRKAERNWIEYALSKSKFELLQSGKTRLVKAN